MCQTFGPFERKLRWKIGWVSLNFAYMRKKAEKIGVGVQKFGGKNPKKGKNLGGGCHFGLIWENIPYVPGIFSWPHWLSYWKFKVLQILLFSYHDPWDIGKNSFQLFLVIEVQTLEFIKKHPVIDSQHNTEKYFKTLRIKVKAWKMLEHCWLLDG